MPVSRSQPNILIIKKNIDFPGEKYKKVECKLGICLTVLKRRKLD